MKVMPVCLGCMLMLWGPLVVLAVYPHTVAMSAGYTIAWSAAVAGGAIASRATERDRFVPALLTGLWAGCMAVLFSPLQENIAGSISTICVYAFFAVLGSMLIPSEPR